MSAIAQTPESSFSEVISELSRLLPSGLGKRPYKCPFDNWPRDLSDGADSSSHSCVVMEKVFDRANADHLASGVKNAETQSVFSSGKNSI